MIIPAPQYLPKELYHGSHRPKWDVIKCHKTITCAGDPGKFVFAYSNKDAAMLYGFNKFAVNSSKVGTFHMIFLAPFAPDLDADILTEARNHNCYLHVLPPASFKGVYVFAHGVNGPPLEWVNRKDVPVLKVESCPNVELLRRGFQVFAIDPIAIRENLKAGHGVPRWVANFIDGKPRRKIVDDKTFAELLPTDNSRGLLADLCKRGILIWENADKAYDDYPEARPEEFLERLGIKDINEVRPTKRRNSLSCSSRPDDIAFVDQI